MVEEVSPIIRNNLKEISRPRICFLESASAPLTIRPQEGSNVILEEVTPNMRNLCEEPLQEVSHLTWNPGYTRFLYFTYSGATSSDIPAYEWHALHRRPGPLRLNEPFTSRRPCEVLICMNSLEKSKRFNYVKRFSWELNEDYTTKLHYIRQAFEIVFIKESNRTFMVNAGKTILAKFLIPCKKKYINFEEAYNNLISFIEEPSNAEEIAKTLRWYDVKNTNFFDVVLCFLVLQVIHDVENIVHVLQRKVGDEWVAHTRLTKDVDGFLYYIGEMLNILVPDLLASVRYGGKQRIIFDRLKKHISCFIADIFTYEKESYTVTDELAKTIYENLIDHIDVFMAFTAKLWD